MEEESEEELNFVFATLTNIFDSRKRRTAGSSREDRDKNGHSAGGGRSVAFEEADFDSLEASRKDRLLFQLVNESSFSSSSASSRLLSLLIPFIFLKEEEGEDGDNQGRGLNDSGDQKRLHSQVKRGRNGPNDVAKIFKEG